MSGLLDSKSIVVTGAAVGLGRAYALALADAGAQVVLNDLDEQRLLAVADEVSAAGGQSVVHAGSVADWDCAAAMVRACVETFGGIDGLVNNAALHHAASSLDETEARVRRIVEVNVLGAMFPALHAFRTMAAQGSGRILNVTSGAHLGHIGMTAYGTTKGAVASLTYNLSLEAAGVGVCVNALAPVAQTGMSPAGTRSDGVPRPRPEQIAPVVVHLMSDAAAGLNGQVVRYDGRSLSLMRHPQFSEVRATEGIDTAMGIADAFATTLAEQLSTTGLY